MTSPVAADEFQPPVDGSAIERGGMLFGRLTPLFAAALPENDERRRKSTQDLIGAGYYHPHAWDNLAAVRYLGIILPILAGGLLLTIGPAHLEWLAIGGMVLGACCGWAIPKLYVQLKAAERRRKIERAMPDMLDLLNMCVSQGMTLPVSVARIRHEIASVYPELSQELAIVSEQARVGSLEQALQNLSRRVDVPEVHAFTTLLVQTEQMGTSVSEALADHSDSIRESLRQRADQAANTAAFKLLFPTALFLMPAVFLFLMGPAIVDLSNFFEGEAGAAFRQNQAVAERTLDDLNETASFQGP